MKHRDLTVVLVRISFFRSTKCLTHLEWIFRSIAFQLSIRGTTSGFEWLEPQLIKAIFSLLYSESYEGTMLRVLAWTARKAEAHLYVIRLALWSIPESTWTSTKTIRKRLTKGRSFEERWHRQTQKSVIHGILWRQQEVGFKPRVVLNFWMHPGPLIARINKTPIMRQR